jgi:hypothetical protein
MLKRSSTGAVTVYGVAAVLTVAYLIGGIAALIVLSAILAAIAQQALP